MSVIGTAIALEKCMLSCFIGRCVDFMPALHLKISLRGLEELREMSRGWFNFGDVGVLCVFSCGLGTGKGCKDERRALNRGNESAS